MFLDCFKGLPEASALGSADPGLSRVRGTLTTACTPVSPAAGTPAAIPTRLDALEQEDHMLTRTRWTQVLLQ